MHGGSLEITLTVALTSELCFLVLIQNTLTCLKGGSTVITDKLLLFKYNILSQIIFFSDLNFLTSFYLKLINVNRLSNYLLFSPLFHYNYSIYFLSSLSILSTK